jgi:hypothetical protein
MVFSKGNAFPAGYLPGRLQTSSPGNQDKKGKNAG